MFIIYIAAGILAGLMSAIAAVLLGQGWVAILGAYILGGCFGICACIGLCLLPRQKLDTKSASFEHASGSD